MRSAILSSTQPSSSSKSPSASPSSWTMKSSTSSSTLERLPRFADRCVAVLAAAASFATASQASTQSAYTSTGAERSAGSQPRFSGRAAGQGAGPFVQKFQMLVPRTICICLECLAAHLALQVSDAGLLLDGHGNRVLVVAEETLESAGELLLLRNRSAHDPGYATVGTRLFGALGLLRRLALTLRTVRIHAGTAGHRTLPWRYV